jgi:hypothetical protein
MGFDELVEELGGTLIQVPELAALVVVKLGIRVICQHFPDEQARLGVRHLPALIRRFREAFCAVYVDGSCRPRQGTEEPTTQNG